MSLTVAQARDEMNALMKSALSGAVDAIQWDDIPASNPGSDKKWARVTIKHENGGQATLANRFGIRRYERRGTLFVQLFTPPGDGLSLSNTLTKLALDAIEGKTTAGGIWFRQVRVNEIGADKGSYQVNVVANFTYDEIK